MIESEERDGWLGFFLCVLICLLITVGILAAVGAVRPGKEFSIPEILLSIGVFGMVFLGGVAVIGVCEPPPASRVRANAKPATKRSISTPHSSVSPPKPKNPVNWAQVLDTTLGIGVLIIAGLWVAFFIIFLIDALEYPANETERR